MLLSYLFCAPLCRTFTFSFLPSRYRSLSPLSPRQPISTPIPSNPHSTPISHAIPITSCLLLAATGCDAMRLLRSAAFMCCGVSCLYVVFVSSWRVQVPLGHTSLRCPARPPRAERSLVPSGACPRDDVFFGCLQACVCMCAVLCCSYTHVFVVFVYPICTAGYRKQCRCSMWAWASHVVACGAWLVAGGIDGELFSFLVWAVGCCMLYAIVCCMQLSALFCCMCALCLKPKIDGGGNKV